MNDKQPNAFDLSGMSGLGMVYQRKIMEITQANAQAAMEFGTALAACREPGDFMRITQDYTTRQMAAFQKQAQELMSLAQLKG